MAEDRNILRVTCTAPVNIAVIKYWGKRDSDLILPINPSLSVTLHQDQLKSTTTVTASRYFKEDRIWINGKEENIENPRLQTCLREVRRLARKRRNTGDENSNTLTLNYKVHICSVNNFPTAAGLASSAAGYACLVYALAKLYGLEGELSEIARQGSGSACRSMYGGFVQWTMGVKEDGSDSIAQQIEPETHWPELRVLILVVNAEQKPVSSTAGMQTSVKTSALLKYRAEIVPKRMLEMIEAIKQQDFETFGQLTMKDSNQFHATCLDTFPPIFYLNEISKSIINLVHRYNSHFGETLVAYTFDAGPNAVIYTLEQHVDEFVEVVKHYFPPEENGEQFLKGLPVNSVPLPEPLKSSIHMDPIKGGIRYIINTQVGPGPQLLEDLNHYLVGEDGLAKQ
ncbi:diphosphomevalonate decarboxylase isoform X1 [Pristis pectinata]|uniref:diphosphomevalonate decarboxylase isoform X1 n=1 Tax=Pristis pectinata TaxID=685728 RepID=UPI00223D0C5A|nr:diphosphomevalonate decarboxylase isoform X1 [Pristis pectinata]XP_051884055.1 diphosphomevalonate decarboxylase isoform X1 [Pristis pectinata]